MSIQIQNALGILSSDVPTGNLLWVDEVNGVDKLAMRGRMTIPFRTLTAAKDAAMAGDTLIVLPGTYNETSLAKDGVNWHFCSGAIVDYSGDSEGGIFAALENPCSFKVTGHGVFRFRIENTLMAPLVGGLASGDSIYLECDQLESGGFVLDASGTITVRCNSMKSFGAACVLATIGPEKLLIVTNEISSSADHAIVSEYGSSEIYAKRIVSTAGSGIVFRGGTIEVTAREIVSTTDYALACDASSGLCRIRGARLLGSVANDKEAIYIDDGSELIGLQNCALIAGGAATLAINATSMNTKVLAYGDVVANQDKAEEIEFCPPLFCCCPNLT